MIPTIRILERISGNSKENQEEVFTRLYRYLLRPDIYHLAYKNLYCNGGAGTLGINKDTADGFSEDKIDKIIKSLADETYQPSPVRRTYIEKKGNKKKKRPLGIPTFTDKLVQEVLRMILEAVYEPVFLNCSHGFRPKRSCHTALQSLKKEFNGARWFVEGDIKGCFDNIDHSTLVGFLSTKIKDARIVNLVYKFLKAGYMEKWKYHKTYSGTPQGGIISPLLANIYLHELDKYAEKLKTEFNKIERHGKRTYEYTRLTRKMSECRKAIDKSNGEAKELLLQKYKALKAEKLKTPSKSQTDKKLKYIRYADDFLIAINGSREDCEWIKRKLADFISETLKMELSEEKTLITHSDNCARFLGYDVRVRRSSKVKRVKGKGYTKRTLSNNTELTIPLNDKIHKFIFDKGVGRIKDGVIVPMGRFSLINLTDLEILMTYNAELRGICNYYNLSSNFNKISYLAWLMEYSCLKTLATKHKSRVKKMIDNFQDGKGKWGIPYETKSGMKRCYFVNFADCKKNKIIEDSKANTAIYSHSITTLEDRLKAKVCELCGATESERFEIHHVNKVKNLKGKEHWERIMIAKRRKTLVVCRQCHLSIHNQ